MSSIRGPMYRSSILHCSLSQLCDITLLSSVTCVTPLSMPHNAPPSPPFCSQLADLGLAGLGDDKVNLASSPGGTLTFMAPVQLGEGAVGPGADVWAVGCMLWSALERKNDPWGDMIGAKLEKYRATGAVPEPLSAKAMARCGAVGPKLQLVLDGCLQADPEQRWSILHVVIELMDIVKDLEVQKE